jgi:peptide/nickel transport system substrate-binding protein
MAAQYNYWGDDQPKFKNLIFKEVPEFTTRLLELKNGDADVIDAGQRANVPQILTTDNVLVVDDLPGLVVASMFFNFDIKGEKNPLIGSGACDGKGIPPDFFRDVNVRKAFAFSFDHDKYIRDIFLGKAVTPATPDIKGLPFHDPKVEGIGFDRNKAREAFAAAKCGNKSVNETGFTFTIRYNTGNLARQAAANLLKADVESFNRNFHINVEGVPFSEILNQIDSGELPMWILGWAPDFIDDADYVNQWMGSSAVGAAFSGPASIDKLPAWGTPGKTPGGIEYKNWDDLLLKAQSDPNDARRRDMYSHLQKLFVDNALAIMLSQPTVFFVQRTWLDGYRYNPGDPGNVFNVLTAYSKKADALPNVDDLCKNYPTATFHFGPKDTVKTCKDFGK